MSDDKHGERPYIVLTHLHVEMAAHQAAPCPQCRGIEVTPGRGTVQKKGQIVVVEPDDLIVGLLQCWLSEAGYTVVVEAAKKLTRPDGAASDPLLVIIDVPKPRAPGQLIGSVREAYASPILLLSARLRRGTDGSGCLARQLGVRKVLPKPFTRDELLAAVSESIDGH